jgi:hypothetical protein
MISHSHIPIFELASDRFEHRTSRGVHTCWENCAAELSTILVDILVDQHAIATVHRGISRIATGLVSERAVVSPRPFP